MNGSQEPKFGSCLVEGFRFLGESIPYLVVFGGNILHRQDELYERSNYEQFGWPELFTLTVSVVIIVS